MNHDVVVKSSGNAKLSYNRYIIMILKIIILAIVWATSTSLLAEPPGPFRAASEPLTLERPSATVPDIQFIDIKGNPGALSDYQQNLATVIVVRDAQCPVSKRYGHKLARLEQEFHDKGIRFLFLNAAPHNPLESIWSEIAAFDFQGRYVIDKDHAILSSLDGNSSTEVFVLDGHRKILYRGAIDDQHGLGYSRREMSHDYLRSALNAVIGNTPITTAATTAPGCFLRSQLEEKNTYREDLTFYRDISPILQTYCQSCHNPNGIAPFPLISLNDVQGRHAIIRFVLENKIMPPWGADHQGGPWANSLKLPDNEREKIIRWINQDTPAGKLDDAPVPLTWSTDWKRGKPDLILTVEDPINIPAEGTVPYIHRVIRNTSSKDLWVRGFEIRSKVPKATHHILAFLDQRDNHRVDPLLNPDVVIENNETDVLLWALKGYFIGLVPGINNFMFPPGMAKRIPPDADIMLQMHYTTNGTAAVDQPEVGLYLSDTPPEHQIHTNSAASHTFEIPPHAGNYQVDADYAFEKDTTLIGFLPHMHLRGKAFRYELVLANGDRTVLLNVPRYDQNWQIYYQLIEPITAPAGSRLHATGWLDNSAQNPANPNPDETVRFGRQIWEEMVTGYFDWIEATP